MADAADIGYLNQFDFGPSYTPRRGSLTDEPVAEERVAVLAAEGVVVDQLGGQLQVIALEHADFEDSWFAESVVQRWRGGEALIPQSWLRSLP